MKGLRYIEIIQLCEEDDRHLTRSPYVTGRLRMSATELIPGKFGMQS